MLDTSWSPSQKPIEQANADDHHPPAPTHDEAETRLILLALLEEQHVLLRSHIDEKHTALLNRIDRCIWPILQPVRASLDGSSDTDPHRKAPDNRRQATPTHTEASQCDQLGTDDQHELILVMPRDDVGPTGEDSPRSKPYDCPSLACQSLHADSMAAKWTSFTMFLGPWRQIQEQGVQAGDGLLRKSVSTGAFDYVVGSVILLNFIVMMLHSQWQGYKASVTLGIRKDDGSWNQFHKWFGIGEHAFTAFFIAELLARIGVYKLRYFRSIPHIFDASLVLCSAVDLYILQPLELGVGANMTMLRLLRLCKFVRMLRIIRVMQLFESLRILVQAILVSLPSLMWSLALLAMIIMISGLLMCQFLATFILDEAEPIKTRTWVYNMYGDTARATLTMFEATMSGCWPNYSRTLIEEVSPWFGLFFVVYIAGVVFAVTRIISAIFLRETLRVASEDEAVTVATLRRQRSLLMKRLANFFREADQSGDGMVDRDEFEKMLENPAVLAWFQGLDLQVHESTALFNLLDSGGNEVSLDEFLSGIVRLKGQARSLDMVSLMRDVQRLREEVVEMFKKIRVPDSILQA